MRSVGCRGERDVTFAGQHSGSRVQANPARARQIDFRPGVQIGGIFCWVRLQLDQISGNKARRQSQMAQNLYQQPTRIAAGTCTPVESLFAGLNARIEPRRVSDSVAHAPVQIDYKAGRIPLFPRNLTEETRE